MAQFLQPIPVCRTSGIQSNRSFPTGSKSRIHSWTWKSQHKVTGFRSKIWARVQDSYSLCLPLCTKVVRLVLSPTMITVTAISTFWDMFKTTSWLHTPWWVFFNWISWWETQILEEAHTTNWRQKSFKGGEGNKKRNKGIGRCPEKMWISPACLRGCNQPNVS